MGRRASRTGKPKSRNVPVKSKPQTNNNSSPVLSNIGQGMSLGAGAAIGSTLVHGTIGSVLGNSVEKQSNQTNNDCLDVFKQYHECANNTNDLNLCRPYIDFYTKCIQNQQKLN